MSGVHFAAWGSVDVESMERIQRRTYIRRVREQLKPHGITLECGGQPPGAAHYQVKHKIGDQDMLKYTGASFREAMNMAVAIIEGDKEGDKPEK